jgi:beta-galactosidase
MLGREVLVSTHDPGSDGENAGRRRARLTRHGLALGEEELPLLSGALHYFQLPRESWGRCLDAVCELGLPIVESYVPWSVHERRGGGFAFEGRSEDGRFERDLGAFLDAAHARGLRVILRPGPHVNAELSFFGYPERVLRDERCLARGPTGSHVILPVPPRAFPVPSYASERFLEEAGAWLAAVSAELAPRAWPDGPLVAAQVDNEPCYFFRTAAYDQDYHRDAVAAYRRFLAARYPDGLPAAYGGVALASLEPPHRFDAAGASSPEALVPHLDWLAYKEAAIPTALAQLAEILRAGGLELPLLANLPMSAHGAACGLAALEGVVDAAGYDLYLRARDYDEVRRAARRLSGSSRLPCLPELGCGSFLWWFPLAPADQQATALAALMHGVRGFNLYMLVERDRWYGSPVGPDGARRRERFEAVRALVSAFRASALHTLAREARVGLLEVREHARLQSASSLLDPVSPMLLSVVGLGPEAFSREERFGLEGGPLEAARHARLAEAALEARGLAFDLVDSGLEAGALARYRLLVCPSLAFVDRGLLARLASYVAGGGALLLVGDRPRLDEAMRPLPEGALPPHEHLPGSGSEAEERDALARSLEALAARLGLEGGPRAESAAVELALRSREDGTPALLFLANRSAAPARVGAIQGLPPCAARDTLTGAPVELGALRLAAHEVRALTLEPAPAGAGGAP